MSYDDIPPVIWQAVELAHSADEHVRKDDNAIPRGGVTIAGFSSVTLDPWDRLVHGTAPDGTDVAPRRDLGGTVFESMTSTSDIFDPAFDGVWDRASAVAVDKGTGQRLDGALVVEAVRARELVVELQTLVNFGDSMTESVTDGGVTWSKLVADTLGTVVTNAGQSGQTSSEIALRQGGLEVLVAVPGNAIPSGAIETFVSVLPITGWHPDGYWNFSGTLAGIAGTLRHHPTNGWSFIRSFAGAAQTLPPDTVWVPSQAEARRYSFQTLWVGRNNPDQHEIVLRDLLAMSQFCQSGYVIFPVFNTSAEPAGSAAYADRMALNAKIATVHGRNYFDIRRWLIDHGLADVGITPTTQDNTDISNDVVPLSLRRDNTHLNEAGATALAHRYARLLVERGIFL